MDDPTRQSFQAALMATSVWVLGGLLLTLPFAVVGLGGIVLLLGTLAGARVVVRRLMGDPDDDVSGGRRSPLPPESERS